MMPVGECRHAGLLRLALAMTLICVSSAFAPAESFARTGSSQAPGAQPYATSVAEAAQRFDISEASIRAVMRVESGGDPRAISTAGAIGLMQIMPATWRVLTARYGLGTDPFDVRANILAGAAYLREMLDRYGDLAAALAAYNAGPGRVDEWRSRARSLPMETLTYVARIAPAVGANGIGSPVRSISIAPDWRAAGIFIAPRDGASSGTRLTSGSQPADRVLEVAPTVRVATSLPAGSLFVPLSGRSDQ